MAKAVLPLDEVVDKLAGVGIPGLVLLVVMAGTGWAGGAAITTALAILGGPAGMIGGISVLVLMGIISAALAKYGVDAIAKGVVRKLKREGETAESITKKVNNYRFLSGKQKALLRDYALTAS